MAIGSNWVHDPTDAEWTQGVEVGGMGGRNEGNGKEQAKGRTGYVGQRGKHRSQPAEECGRG